MGWFGRVFGERREASASVDPYHEAVEEAKLLLEHGVKSGIDLPPERLSDLATVIHGAVSAPEEERVDFWVAYHELAGKLLPVTGASLRAVNGKGNAASSAAELTVRRYRLIGFAALMLVLVVQVYWVVGTDLFNNMQSLFDARQKKARESGLKWYELYSRMDEPQFQELSVLNQKLDANYKLLEGWNKAWQWCFVITPYSGDLTESVRTAYSLHMMTLRLNETGEDVTSASGAEGEAASSSSEQMAVAMLNMKLDKARNAMFMTELSAGFVLRAMQVYLLPLAYGLLGAATFVLRSLSREIRELTFLPENEVKYRLRLSLGSLSGLAVGWFLRPEEVGLAGALSPLALAFLIGYNIEILFSWMDRAVAGVIRSKERAESETA